MNRMVLWICITVFLAGCGRLVTPEPESTAETGVTPSPQEIAVTNTPRPTSTPRPVTPVASPTPTITPTPVIYSVQAGDTLLKIAIQFDRTTEAIQEANGIVDPRFLQIGQALIIPPPETSPEAPPSPTPTPPPLGIDGINFQRTRQGTLWGLGEVSNPGDEYLTEVVVEASLFDGSGVLLAREATFTQLDVVPPGQAVPFALLFEAPPGDFAQYQVVPVSGVPLSPEARYYFALEAFDLAGSPAGAALYRIEGKLRNTGAIDAESIRLVAVAYDENDRILAQRQAELAVSLLKAGAITSFEIELVITRGIVADYKVLVQGFKAE